MSLCPQGREIDRRCVLSLHLHYEGTNLCFLLSVIGRIRQNAKWYRKEETVYDDKQNGFKFLIELKVKFALWLNLLK